MKEERLQLIPMKYTGWEEITLKNYMPRNMTTQMKCTNFQKKYSLPKLNDKEAENVNRTITAVEIEAVIKKLPTHKSPGPDGFPGKFYKAFKEELTPNLHRLFEKIQTDGRLPNSL